MFVLRFKPDTHRLLYSEASKGFVSVNIGGRYFCDTPTRQTGYTTKEISKAKVFTQPDGKMSSMYFADCEPVEVTINLK